MSTMNFWAESLATAFLAGPWELDALVDRAGKALGKRWRWIRPLARRVLQAFPTGTFPRRQHLADFIQADAGFQRAWQAHDLAEHELDVAAILHSAMSAARVPYKWSVPQVDTSGALAEWLAIAPNELDWFADWQSREQTLSAGPLRHYHYRRVPKRSGADRVIEIPKPRLKALQRKILHEILDLLPVHDAAHGFRRGRSIKTLVEPHVGQTVVLKMDLKDFFPTISRARVFALFRLVGYPEAVARLLAGLCCNSVPADLWESAPVGDELRPQSRTFWRTRELYRRPHLPQGAPTSPALANLCAYRLDCRLAGLAHHCDAHYTRYADDLVFSGGAELARSAKRFHAFVGSIVLEEGFELHYLKTRIMRQAVRQRVVGVVVNEHPNVARDDYDELKATLYNCVQHGLSSQSRSGQEDFRAHLAGRIAHVTMLNPARGEKLRKLFEKID
jgi:RNA-directed DNA polymerase